MVKTSPPLGKDWEAMYHHAEEQRQRVVRAFIALRNVKTLGTDLEPAVRHVRLLIAALPSLTALLEFEDERTIQQILQIETWRMLQEFDEQMIEAQEQPRSPVYARYIDAAGKLDYGDLALPR